MLPIHLKALRLKLFTTKWYFTINLYTTLGAFVISKQVY